MADPFYGYDHEDAPPKGRDNLFLWTVFILLLIGVAFACWLGSFYIFGHPEQPRAYRFLKKLGKIEAPRRFEDTAGPSGDFLSAQKLYERYSNLKSLELDRDNAELLRNYINNYRDIKKLVPYLRGKFDIIAATELKKGDLFESGVVALAQSAEFPQLIIEHVFPGPPASVPSMLRALQVGYPFPIRRSDDLSAVIHAEKIHEGRLQLTVVPLLYPTYGVKGGVGYFGTEPPADLYIEAGLPIVKKPELQQALKTFAEYRRKNPVAPPGEASAIAATTPVVPEVQRIDTLPEGVKPPTTGALPEMPIATPIPVPGRTAAAQPPVTSLALNTTPRPVATPIPPARNLAPPPAPAATPIPRMSPEGVPLTPFIASNPAPDTPLPGATWRTYAPGQAPAGRSISPNEAGGFADRGDLGGRLYLRGQFVVTAAGENTAILRPQTAGATPAASGTRIIVNYPGGAVPPAEGSTFARDDARPFEIRDIRRGDDGVVNITVREITQ